jgi:hypothetical protein
MDPIAAALNELDPANDDHWTEGGAPRIDAVSALVGTKVTRQQIIDAAPDLTRELLQSEQDRSQRLDEPDPDADVDQEANPVTDDHVEGMTSLDYALMVEVGDEEVIAMPPAQVYNDAALIDRATEEFSRQQNQLIERKARIEAKLAELSIRTERLQRARTILYRRGLVPKGPSPIAAYLEQQRKVRAEKTNRALRFIEAGTSAEDVREALTTKSKIDQVMGQRRTRGGGRPSYPVNVPNE